METNAERLTRQLKEGCERWFEIGEPTSMAFSVTGEPYVCIAKGWRAADDEPGTVAEGSKRECFANETAAFFGALSAFTEYAAGKSGKLYWRVEPYLIHEESSYVFYMRCLISDEPELPKNHKIMRGYYESIAEQIAVPD